MTDCTESEVRLAAHLDAGEWEAVVAALDSCWAHMIEADPAVVRRAVSSLPPDVLRQHPRLASAGQYFDRMASDPRSTTRFHEAPPAAPRGLLDLLASLTAQAATARARGAFDAALDAAEEASALLAESTNDARRGLSEALPELTYQWGMARELAGDVDGGAREYIEAFDLSRIAGNAATEARAAGSIAWTHAFAGRNDEARRWLARIPETRGHAWHERTAVVARLTRALLAIDDLDDETARIELAGIERQTAAERWPLRQLLTAALATTPAEALTLLVELDAYVETSPAGLSARGLPRTVIALTRSMLTRTTGDHARATTILIDGASDDPSPRRGSGGWLAVQLLDAEAATAAASAGDGRGALAIAERLRGTATTSPRLLVIAWGLVAAERLRNEELAGAAEAFRNAAGLAMEQGLLRSLSRIPAADLGGLIALVPEALPPTAAERASARAASATPDPFLALSPSERRVLDELLRGATTAEIAARFVLSPNTVKTQARNVYRKADVHTRAELFAVAARFGYGAPERGAPSRDGARR